MERRFECTMCGKCCYGQVPLTIADALAHAERFPLAIIWTPVRPGTQSYDHVVRLGTTTRLPNRKEIAVRISPTAYIPPSLPCPALKEDGKCGIQNKKPARCRTMPFSPYREESHQAELLIPRQGWECDTSTEAPVVYRDDKIVPRDEFDFELAELLRESEIITRYADWLLASAPTITSDLMRVAKKKSGGQVIVNFSTLLLHLPEIDVVKFAKKQLPVVTEFIKMTSAKSELKTYHQHYGVYAEELTRVIKS